MPPSAAIEPPSEAVKAKETPLAAEEAPKTATPAAAFGFGSYSSNAFASLTNGANTTPGFGGGFGGGGFGSAISKAPTATPAASPLFGGALPTPGTGTGTGTSGFAFTTGAFPNIAPQAFKTPMAEGDDAEGDENVEVFADSTAEFKPVVNLPQAQKTVTGEEEEMTAYTASDAILYEFQANGQKWVERGKGEFKLNIEKPSGQGVPKARMILRQAGSLRLLLNASVHSKMVCNLMAGDVGISFAAQNAAAAPSNSPEPASATAGDSAPVSPSNAHVTLSTWAVKIRGRGVDPATRLFSLINQHKDAMAARGEDVDAKDESKV